MTRSLETDLANAVDAFDWQLRYDAVSRVGQGLEMSFSALRGICPVALTHVSQVVSTSICWQCKEIGDEKKRKPPKVFLSRPDRVLRRRHDLEGQAKDAALDVTVSLNIFDLWISFTVPLVLPG